MDKAKILVVEDDLFLRDLYIETLETEGYDVTFAVDGEDAANKMRPGGYDLVLLDIVLPKKYGTVVLKELLDQNIKPGKVVVFLTNLDNDQQIKDSLKMGDGYLVKSQITPNDLLNEVKTYLTNSDKTPPTTS